MYDSAFFEDSLRFLLLRTTLAEIAVYQMEDAHKLMGQRPGGYTPVIVTPRSSSQCCCCLVSFPEGFDGMVRSFGGANVRGDNPNGTWTPGLKVMNPLNTVSRLISTSTFVFDTPVKSCMSADYNYVNIDVLILFNITDPVTFVTKLGAEKLDSLLRAAQEEAIRKLAATHAVTEMFDLFGEESESTVAEMNTKFETYGVNIKYFTIKQVTVPQTIVESLEATTLTDSKEKRLEVEQRKEDQKGKHEEERIKLREESDNKKMAAEEEANFRRQSIEKEVAEVVAMTEKAVAEREAEMKAAVEETSAQSDLKVAEMEAATKKLDREVEAETRAEVGKLKAEAEAYKKRKDAEAKVAATKLRSEGKKALAAAEGEAAQKLASKRQYEADLKRLEILDNVAQNPMIRIASSHETAIGLAPENSLIARTVQAGMEAMQAKFGNMIESSRAPAIQRM
jgi:regulator of protease activity HflC (stomatin/prohibitin superfamily)